MPSKFHEIYDEDLPILNSLLEKRMPFSAMICNTVQLCLRNRVPMNRKTKFYTFDRNLTDSEAAFILNIQEDLAGYCVILSTPTVPTLEMLTEFEKFLDWNKRIVFAEVTPALLPYFKELTTRRNPRQHASPPALPCSAFLLRAQDALNFDVDADRLEHPSHASIIVKQLSPIMDVDTVHRNWHLGARTDMVRMSISIASAGVYLNGDLISWAITTPVGTINAVFTMEDHRRQGYGELAMKSIAKLNGTYGLHSVAHVIEDNSVSKQFMEKIGFTFTHSLYWVRSCDCPECKY